MSGSSPYPSFYFCVLRNMPVLGSTAEQDEEEQLIALIESLKGPMAAQGASLKQYMKDAFLPAYNSIRSAHGVLEDKGE